MFFLEKSQESALAMSCVVEGKNKQKQQSAVSKTSHTLKKNIKNIEKIRIDSALHYYQKILFS